MKDGEETSEPQGHVETFELVEEEDSIRMFPTQNVFPPPTVIPPRSVSLLQNFLLKFCLLKLLYCTKVFIPICFLSTSVTCGIFFFFEKK